MTRILFPTLIVAGPAAAHTEPHFHAHTSDYAALGLGLAVLAVIATVLISKLPK
ncbi:hypothetical protein [Ruegeria meonggei]|uniref:Uncharacterized protein n=1 Tax=Ruegeria meonggei TaxID=1446476 RepID=A0A1X6ZZY0_9RHOB|nr:hypothetical protein [Ruegeria meonggei]SLN66070.1 hypothetical protein RUM8411_03294 [Ruegeria meonggei]